MNMCTKTFIDVLWTIDDTLAQLFNFEAIYFLQVTAIVGERIGMLD